MSRNRLKGSFLGIRALSWPINITHQFTSGDILHPLILWTVTGYDVNVWWCTQNRGTTSLSGLSDWRNISLTEYDSDFENGVISSASIQTSQCVQTVSMSLQVSLAMIDRVFPSHLVDMSYVNAANCKPHLFGSLIPAAYSEITDGPRSLWIDLYTLKRQSHILWGFVVAQLLHQTKFRYDSN